MRINFYIDKPKNETSVIKMSISLKGRSFVFLPEYGPSSKWDKKKQLFDDKGDRDLGRINDRLQSYRTEAKTIYNQLMDSRQNPDHRDLSSRLESRIKGETKDSIEFWDSVEIFLSDRSKMGSKSPIKRNNRSTSYEQTKKVLQEYEKYSGIKLKFKSFDSSFYYDFMGQFCGVKKNYTINNAGKHISILKAFLNAATKYGHNSNMKFKDFKVTDTTVDFIILTEEEMDRIAALKLTGGLRTQRDLFLVAYYTGLRYSDFGSLKKENFIDGYIHRVQQKTGSKVIIPIHRKLLPILDHYKYNLPKVLENYKINDYLKKIGKEAKIDEMVTWKDYRLKEVKEYKLPKHDLITTHTARRSFATKLYKERFPVQDIMKITGHKDFTSFRRYIGVTPMESAIMLKDHWDKL